MSTILNQVIHRTLLIMSYLYISDHNYPFLISNNATQSKTLNLTIDQISVAAILDFASKSFNHFSNIIFWYLELKWSIFDALHNIILAKMIILHFTQFLMAYFTGRHLGYGSKILLIISPRSYFDPLTSNSS